YPTGEQRTVFATTEPALVEGEMRELLEWTNEQLAAKEIHPLVVTALFVYEFLSIHPFQDGNGRLSRLLTTLCLLQNEYEFIQYVSFENHVEQRKKAYYAALMSGQRNRNTGKEEISQWLLFFLESLKSLTEKLEQKYSVFRQKGGYLNERQKQINDFIARNQPVKVGDISDHFKEIPINTIKKDLQYLRDEQVLSMVGKGKGSVYVVSEPQKRHEAS
ncbi:MAG: Fic family protein, partial [Prevotellaceae bacterium]|nr:Fic family protein [Prevotellaceae bacterium]